MAGFSPHRLNRVDVAVALALFVLTAGVYLPALGFDFINFDDQVYVYANPHVLDGPSAENVWWGFTTFDAANWHPLTWLSLQLDAAFWKSNPVGYHLTNILLHALNTALVFLVFRTATGFVARSFVLAALWGLHPLHVESVAWVAERKDVLCAFFWLLTMAAYTRYAARPSWGRLLLVAAGCAFALAAKPMAVTLPCVLLLWDFWPLGRIRTLKDLIKRVEEKWLLWVLVAGSCALTFCAQAYGGAVRGFNDISFAQRIANVVEAYTTYLGQTVWPTGLAVYYPLPRDPSPWFTAGSALLLLGVTAGAILLRRHAPYLLAGWLWFLGTLIPVIGLVQVGEQSHADRYTYLPHIGLFAAVVWGLVDLAERLRVPIWWRWALTLTLVAILAFVTRQQISYWRDSGTLWEHAVAVTPDNYYARVALGKYYFGRGDLDAALQCFDEVLREQPDDFEANRMKAVVLRKRGQLPYAK